jgi:hypothetical protein
MTNKNNLFKGRWQIVWMEQWDQEYVNLCNGGHITIDEKGNDEFEFGAVQGGFQIALGQDHFHGEWDGCDEMDKASGDIYGTLEGEELHGDISFYRGDESEYRAVRDGQ